MPYKIACIGVEKCVLVYRPTFLFESELGLESSVAQYADVFQEARITGKQLLSLDYRLLEKTLNIWKIGHQELILHAIQLLEAVVF